MKSLPQSYIDLSTPFAIIEIYLRKILIIALNLLKIFADELKDPDNLPLLQMAWEMINIESEYIRFKEIKKEYLEPIAKDLKHPLRTLANKTICYVSSRHDYKCVVAKIMLICKPFIGVHKIATQSKYATFAIQKMYYLSTAMRLMNDFYDKSNNIYINPTDVVAGCYESFSEY